MYFLARCQFCFFSSYVYAEYIKNVMREKLNILVGQHFVSNIPQILWYTCDICKGAKIGGSVFFIVSKYVCMYVYFHLVHVIITSNVGIILDVQFIIMYTK